LSPEHAARQAHSGTVPEKQGQFAALRNRPNLTHFAQSSKMGTVTKGFDARLANRPFVVFDFRTLRRSTLSASMPDWPESQKLKTIG